MKWRVVSNYTRLATTFITGILILRLVAEMGTAALATFLLLTILSNTALLPKSILQESAIPILGRAYSAGPLNFRATWINLRRLALMAALISAVAMTGAAPFLDKFETGSIPWPILICAFAAICIRAASTTLTAPHLNLILVSGRILTYNLMVVMERVMELTAAIAVTFFFATASEPTQLLWFYMLAAVLHIIAQAAVVFLARTAHPPKDHPTPTEHTKPLDSRALLGWNLVLALGYFGHLRLTTLITNTVYGETAVLVLGVAFLFASYLRQLSMGLAIGLDALSSRITRSQQAGAHSLAKIARHAAISQACVVGFSIAIIWNFIGDILKLWLGDTTTDPAWNTALAVPVIKLLLIGTFARAISEGWMKILNGQGQVRRYAGVVFMGAIINLIVLYTVVGASMPIDHALIVLAATHAAIFICVHSAWVPYQLIRTLKDPLRPAIIRPTYSIALIASLFAWLISLLA